MSTHYYIITKSFVLGKDNVKHNDQINKLKQQLISEDNKYSAQEKTYNDAKQAFGALQEELSSEAKNIKNHQNPSYHVPNYDKNALRKDIKLCGQNSNQVDQQIEIYKKRLNEDEKDKKTELKKDYLPRNPIDFFNNTKKLIEKRLKPTKLIYYLKNDPELSAWVKKGRDLHHERKKLGVCAFCDRKLPENLYQRLATHFNKSSQDLEEDIKILINNINQEVKNTGVLKDSINKDDFYLSYQNKSDPLLTNLEEECNKYHIWLQQLIDTLTTKKNAIFSDQAFEMKLFDGSLLLEVIEKLNTLCDENNQHSSQLVKEKADIRKKLRLHHVNGWREEHLKDQKIDDREIKMNEEKKELDEIKENIDQIEQKIATEKAKLKSEKQAAEKINDYLGRCFANNNLSLQAITRNQPNSDQENPVEYIFEMRRNSEKALHLSEGERSLIAFCYFIAKLDSIETKLKSNMIIWIDDPICSLDYHHVYDIFSLIQVNIMANENIKINDKDTKKFTYDQVFISTHDYTFLQYLIKHSNVGKKCLGLFMIKRNEDTSTIICMPEFLRKVISEYLYLFHQIYKLSIEENNQNWDDQCSFGNHVRKFLEIYAHYKCPGIDIIDRDGLNKIFTKEHDAREIHRFMNTNSHGQIERGIESSPLPIVEIKNIAKIVMDMIKANDEQQYLALKETINKDINSGGKNKLKNHSRSEQSCQHDTVKDNSLLEVGC